MKKKINIVIGLMLCLIFLASVRNFSRIPLGYGPVYYLGGYTLTVLAFYSFCVNKCAHTLTYLAPMLYVIWALWGVFRGQFEITSGFVLNQYFHGILYVLVPMCIFLFAYPDTIIRSFQILNIFTILFSFLSLKWNFVREAYCFAFPPFYYFYLCFFTKIPWKWRVITMIAVGLVLLAYTNSSAFAKVMMSFLVLAVFLLPRILRTISLNVGHWLLYILPLVFFYLGITGQYNIFRGGYIGGANAHIVISSSGTERVEQSIHKDTRTFLYEEVFFSMVKYDCLWTGRTPARGYYSSAFAKDADKSIKGIDPSERFGCEVANLNTLHWLGLIGLILITCVYLQGSCLALYRSNNKYVKCLSLEVAFQWLWSWIENQNRFTMLDLTIYVMLAICYSPYFRKMTDLEFEMFFKSIFSWPGTELHDYNKYMIVKMWFSKKLEAIKYKA